MPRAGTVRLRLPPAAGYTVHAREVEEATLLGAVVPIDEGLGPEILLAAGETRIFSLTVERVAAVGLGVRAGADVVETVLLDAGGRCLGEGVVQMHELEPGDYLLTLTLPATAPPVRARAVVVGLEPPGPSHRRRWYASTSAWQRRGASNHDAGRKVGVDCPRTGRRRCVWRCVCNPTNGFRTKGSERT